MNFLENALRVLASLTVETTSWIGFYEPKVPEQLLKSDKNK